MKMHNNDISNQEFDQLIKSSLGTSSDWMVPDILVEKTILKIEKRALLNELIMELAGKIFLALLSIGVLALVMIWFSGFEILNRLWMLISVNKPMVIMILLSALVIIVIDQILLRYYQVWQHRTVLSERS